MCIHEEQAHTGVYIIMGLVYIKRCMYEYIHIYIMCAHTLFIHIYIYIHTFLHTCMYM